MVQGRCVSDSGCSVRHVVLDGEKIEVAGQVVYTVFYGRGVSCRDCFNYLFHSIKAHPGPALERWRDHSEFNSDTQNGIDVRAIARTDSKFLSFLRSAVPGRILVGLTMGRVRDLTRQRVGFHFGIAKGRARQSMIAVYVNEITDICN